MSRSSSQRSPQARFAKHLRAPKPDAADLLVRLQVERGSEAHPGDADLQILYDEYLDAVALAKGSGLAADMIGAGRLYLRYAKALGEKENLV